MNFADSLSNIISSANGAAAQWYNALTFRTPVITNPVQAGLQQNAQLGIQSPLAASILTPNTLILIVLGLGVLAVILWIVLRK